MKKVRACVFGLYRELVLIGKELREGEKREKGEEGE